MCPSLTLDRNGSNVASYSCYAKGTQPAEAAPAGGCEVDWTLADGECCKFVPTDYSGTLKDYTDNSTIVVYNQVDGSMMSCEGGDEVKKCFTGLFGSLSSMGCSQADLMRSWSPSSLVTTSANQSGSGNVVAIPGQGICSESESWRGAESSGLILATSMKICPIPL